MANGALREAFLLPALGKPSGLILSGVVLCVLVVVVAYGFVRLVRGLTASQGILIGIVWSCLTLAFEFSFGYYIQRKSWSELLEAYAFKEGNLWPLVLLVTLLAPLLVSRLYARYKTH